MNKLLVVKHYDEYDKKCDFFCREVLNNEQIPKLFESIQEELFEKCSDINENFNIIIIDLQSNDNTLTTYKDLIKTGFEQILKAKNNE